MITVLDTYGDAPMYQHMEACGLCGAIVFVAANYPDGSGMDTRQQHTDWHNSMGQAVVVATPVALTPETCDHADDLVVYPGEITTDEKGRVREDNMRLQCPDCNRVVDYDGD